MQARHAILSMILAIALPWSSEAGTFSADGVGTVRATGIGSAYADMDGGSFKIGHVALLTIDVHPDDIVDTDTNNVEFYNLGPAPGNSGRSRYQAYGVDTMCATRMHRPLRHDRHGRGYRRPGPDPNHWNRLDQPNRNRTGRDRRHR